MNKQTFEQIFNAVLSDKERKSWSIVTNIAHGLGLNGVSYDTLREVSKRGKLSTEDKITITSEVKEIADGYIMVEVIKETISWSSQKATYSTTRNYIPYENIVCISTEF